MAANNVVIIDTSFKSVTPSMSNFSLTFMTLNASNGQDTFVLGGGDVSTKSLVTPNIPFNQQGVTFLMMGV
jgi:hypothetical protein